MGASTYVCTPQYLIRVKSTTQLLYKSSVIYQTKIFQIFSTTNWNECIAVFAYNIKTFKNQIESQIR